MPEYTAAVTLPEDEQHFALFAYSLNSMYFVVGPFNLNLPTWFYNNYKPFGIHFLLRLVEHSLVVPS